MADLPILRIILRELCSFSRLPRTPEPEMIMDDPNQVAEYTTAGFKFMMPTYLFHASQACEVIAPNSRVVDLACGPGTQLGLLARLRPDCQFIGIDLAEKMLDIARGHIKKLGLDNVQFQKGDITKLDSITDHEMDAVVSSMSLHHLPDTTILTNSFREMARILKPGGGVYLGDFSRMKLESSMKAFAYRDVEDQPESYTQDFINSLHAAFTVGDFKLASKPLANHVKLFSTFIVPFMIAIKSQSVHLDDQNIRERIEQVKKELSEQVIKDLKDMVQFFKMGGLKSHYLA